MPFILAMEMLSLHRQITSFIFGSNNKQPVFIEITTISLSLHCLSIYLFIYANSVILENICTKHIAADAHFVMQKRTRAVSMIERVHNFLFSIL